ncbi:CCA tRNA nucleotidyltransferase [Arthrobacter sp. TES]|jgi:poly(A) polymerase|uniref:CCA tRNA nucleotidyltransferase n=1 Tax=Paenarthrobacter ureafaciens TaxID=37931 RepID=A0AAX3EHT1_PAEUR|nr:MULTISPECIES: CCA tRNA nucleotidyltransferase [Paenarthrobacter]AMB42291.1 CCA tRNA nucleotidyltransferase [Arthrobacter sp. ATCC 21022]AOY73415.1 RNA nucleotidyltransferase [Arthrobacter sp. ZXY-2]ERI36825.1 RNA nucleotidyltransferase [Arthrobacter sp. AK-YN10]NKR12026.1 CCA tRNA nucleotidyltransferase [Arthrobacter sp. M5]NKR16304.1 CCA tRNA nucleotidyltransferase [Arthrobacter sp. M6]OEH57538.1 CCA tRNA nucleotidyltransferase [Arthrobacter sp. D4]OEH58813.1 CCA tRNA nucleotidyltransfer
MAHVLDSSSVNFTIDPVVLDLGQRFVDAGFELSLVGGPVRDLFLGRTSPDLDFTTDATPDQTISVIKKWADNFWEIGRAFGTIGMRKDGFQIEVTTYRAEAYDPDSRKPVVAFGNSLTDDLLRRDFTINAMALRLPSLELVDPFGGVRDLHASELSTPGAPEASFSDDPLRMMRAARFASQLGVSVHDDVRHAMTHMAERIKIISAERVRDELVKLINGAHPRVGVDLLVDTGLAEFVLPEVSALRLESDEHHRHKDVYQHSLQVLEQAAALETDRDGAVPGPDFVLRFAALMHDVGKPATRRFEPGGAVSFRHHDVVGAKLTAKRMKALRFDNDTIKAVARLVELHMRFYGYGDAGWTDSAVRRYVTDAGPHLERLHRLTRSDVTTRNQRKADRLAFAYDDLEQRIAALLEQESLAAIRPDLDGAQIMALLGLKPGPVVGRAYKFLLEERMEHGPLAPEEAESKLLAWWQEQPESAVVEPSTETEES